MTPSTVGAGWLLVGGFLCFVGWIIVKLACSAWAERRDQRRAREAADTEKTLAAFAELRAMAEQDEAHAAHIQQALDLMTPTQAKLVPFPGRLRSVPVQRKGDAS